MKKLTLLLLVLSTIIFCSQIAYSYPKGQRIWAESVEHVWSKNGDCEIVVTVGHRDCLKSEGWKRLMEQGKVKEWVVFAYYGKVAGKTYYDWIPFSASGRQVSFKVPQAHLQMDWRVKMPYADRYRNEVKRDYELNLFFEQDDPLKRERYFVLRGAEMGCEFGITGDFLDLLNEEWKTESWSDGDVRRRSRFVDCTKEDIIQLFDSTRPPEPASPEYVNFVKENRPTVTIKDYQHSGDWKSGTFTQTYKIGFDAACQARPRSFSIKVKYFATDVASLPGFAPVEALEEIKLKWEPGTQPKTITIMIPQIGLSRHSEYSLSKGPIFVRVLTVIVTESVTGHEPIKTFFELEVGATVTIN
ncbi:MAG: hypothetical protein Q8O03_04445 [Nanoarchaeota archaeon]|nr:hypothetical protein [Nanoarchaeota archaeon]